MKRKLFALLLAGNLLIAPVAYAQDSTAEPPTPAPEATPEPPLNLFPDAPTTEETGASILEVIAEATRWASGLLVTVSLVSLLKRIPLFDGISGGALNLGISIIITILVWFARKYSFQPQLFQGLDFLGGLLSLFLNVGSTTLGSAVVYTGFKATKTPILGYART